MVSVRCIMTIYKHFTVHNMMLITFSFFLQITFKKVRERERGERERERDSCIYFSYLKFRLWKWLLENWRSMAWSTIERPPVYQSLSCWSPEKPSDRTLPTDCRSVPLLMFMLRFFCSQLSSIYWLFPFPKNTNSFPISICPPPPQPQFNLVQMLIWLKN